MTGELWHLPMSSGIHRRKWLLQEDLEIWSLTWASTAGIKGVELDMYIWEFSDILELVYPDPKGTTPTLGYL